MHQQQKHISPALRLSHENLCGTQNSVQNTPTSQSPRLTPGGHARSPRSLNTPFITQVLASGIVASNTTPDRITTSAERRLQQRMKTPTRTSSQTPPTLRTPTPTTAVAAVALLNSNSALLSSNVHQQPVVSIQPPQPSSIICKIDLSRLLNVPVEWQANTYRLYGHTSSHHQNHLTPSAGRTPKYDHETILNADLQSCNNQKRLKSTSCANLNGGSGNATPKSTGNRTPVQITSSVSSVSDREFSHSRENICEITKDNGSICGGVSTSKEQLPPPNGYNTTSAVLRGYNSPNATVGGVKSFSGVKHEFIKHEPDPDFSCSETKFKSDSSAEPTLIKQELSMLKQDFKPSDLLENSSLCSPKDLSLDPKIRRKRSSSSSSSPYKEKKRKKELSSSPLSEKEKITVSSDDVSKQKGVDEEPLKSTKECVAINDCSVNNISEQQKKQARI